MGVKPTYFRNTQLLCTRSLYSRRVSLHDTQSSNGMFPISSADNPFQSEIFRPECAVYPYLSYIARVGINAILISTKAYQPFREETVRRGDEYVVAAESTGRYDVNKGQGERG